MLCLNSTCLANVRKLFCYHYIKCGNVEEASIKAGFPKDTAFIDGMKTLALPQYQKLIREFKDAPTNSLLWAGLQRLAFGSVNDAIGLVFSENPIDASSIYGLDLFNVSEVKRVKGGGVEVKFFDRQKALEKMLDYANSNDSSNTAKSLLDALCSSSGGDAIDD